MSIYENSSPTNALRPLPPEKNPSCGVSSIKNVETTDNVIFTQNVLDSKNFYFYQVAPVDANGNKFYSNTVYSRPNTTECNAITPTTGNDSDLLVYYAFKGNLNDTHGNYHLTTLGGGISGYTNNYVTG